MSTFSHKACLIMQEKLLQTMKDFSYRLKLYGINYSIAIGYSPENVDLTPLSQHIRESDLFIVLDHNTCAVILDSTNDESGIKTANNLLSHFQGKFFSTSLYSAIVIASNYDTVTLMMHDLFYLLDYAIKNNMNNIIMESYQVIHKHQAV